VRPRQDAATGMTATDEFVEFAAAASARLRRTAFLLCGNWHTAEDLAQTTLAKMFVSWRRIRRHEAAYSYATRTLVNTYLADRRLGKAAEVLTSELPERPSQDPAPELRLLVLDALATLPPQARVIVVLRYWADMSVGQVANLLGCSEGNVKSQAARGLDKMRPLLSEVAIESDRRGHPAGQRRETRNAGHG
jgi:RNA polymerase sigma-70 factor (sigma-E family)